MSRIGSRTEMQDLAFVSAQQWTALGRAARRTAPRSSHGEWQPAASRPDPVALLEQQAQSRVPELVPIRHGRMLVSPSTFYRGAAFIMAADLAATPVSGFEVQLCGDAHLLNFGPIRGHRLPRLPPRPAPRSAACRRTARSRCKSGPLSTADTIRSQGAE